MLGYSKRDIIPMAKKGFRATLASSEYLSPNFGVTSIQATSKPLLPTTTGLCIVPQNFLWMPLRSTSPSGAITCRTSPSGVSVKELLNHCVSLPKQSFEAGQVILTEDGTTDKLSILETGILEVYRGDDSIAMASDPGSVFGEMSVLLDSATRPMFAQ
jgi:hypothetical protein